MKKNGRFIFAILLISALFVGCAGAAPSNVANNSDQPTLSVTGTGQVFVVPDIAYINIGVRSEGDSVTEAIAANNTQAQQIKDALVAEGISEEDIQTSSFNVYQQSDYDFQGNPTNSYFSVENTVYVTVREISSLGVVLDAVGRGGANNIYGVNFDVEDKTEAQSTARSLAVQAAQTQAGELAQAAGVELGELLSINSSATTTSQNFYGYGMGGGAAVADSVPISAGQMPVNAQVVLTYAFK